MKIQVRRGTTAQWATADAASRFLALGEFGLDTALNVLKIGTGAAAWSVLTAIGSGGGTFAAPIEVNGAGVSVFDDRIEVDGTGANIFVGPIRFVTAGVTLQIASGANGAIGTAVLVAGTVTVATTAINGASLVFVTCQTPGGTPGFLRVANKVNGVGFDIVSSDPLDTSTVAWVIFEAP